MKIHEYGLAISEVIRETPETVTLRFSLDNRDFSFVPGQFVMLTCDTGKGDVTRPLSIASAPGEGVIDLTIKCIDGGAMSPFLCNTVKKGDVLKIKGPYGVFTYDGKKEKGDLVFIAAGSGIVPFRSIWRHVIREKMDTKMLLLFSSKTTDYIIYKKELDEMNNDGKMGVVHTLTRNKDPSWNGFSRRIDKEMIKEVVQDFQDKLFYACGPPKMVDSVVEDLKELGVDEKMIKTERYD